VEDNLVNQRVLQKQLKNLGCIVHVANHGGEALVVLRKSTYWNHAADTEQSIPESERIGLSVVLMDQEMPVMDGLTCTKKIRELEKEGKLIRHVPVIAVTANARIEQIETAMNAGMVSFVVLVQHLSVANACIPGRCNAKTIPHPRAHPKD
jgi:CheY-like chemotaxis protein